MKKKILISVFVLIVIGVVLFFVLNKEQVDLYQTYEGPFFECEEFCEIDLYFGGKKNNLVFERDDTIYSLTFNNVKLVDKVDKLVDFAPNFYYAFDDILVIQYNTISSHDSKIVVYDLNGKELSFPEYESLFVGFEESFESIRLEENKFIVERDALIDFNQEEDNNFYLYSCNEEISLERGFNDDTVVFKAIEFEYSNNSFSNPKEVETKTYKEYLEYYNLCENIVEEE